MTDKRCSLCEEVKPLAAFSPDRRRDDGRTSRCRECCAEVARAKYADTQRTGELYGLTPDAYRALIAGGCAICGKKDGRLGIDHDHTTGAVRGCLCIPCNTSVGLLGDDPDRCRVAAAYLERGQAAQPTFPYLWAWGQKPEANNGTPPRVFDRDRRGESCRVVCRGRMNSALVEFQDGYRVVTSRNGLRKDSPT